MLKEEIKKEFKLDIFDEITEEINKQNIEKSKENYLRIGKEIEENIMLCLKKERKEKDIVKRFKFLGKLKEWNKKKDFLSGTIKLEAILFSVLTISFFIGMIDFFIYQDNFITHFLIIVFIAAGMIFIYKDLVVLNNLKYKDIFNVGPYKKIRKKLNKNEYKIYKFLKKNDMITNQNIYNYSDYLKNKEGL